MGFEYFANLLFSCIALIILLSIKRLRKRLAFWEIPIIVLIPLLFSIAFLSIVINSKTKCVEYWGSTVVKLYEEEPWNEWIHQTCTRSYPCGTDANGNTTYCTETYDCSYQADYCPEWYVITSSNEKIKIDEKTYDKFLKKIGGKRIAIKTRRNHSASSFAACTGHKKDSRLNGRVGKTSFVYESIISSDDEISKQIPVTTTHKYKNKLKATDKSVLGYSEVDTSDISRYKLLDYPLVQSPFYQQIILGEKVSFRVQERYNILNGIIGPKVEGRIYICLFKNQPIDAAIYQEAYWVGGNKNEVIICVGLDENNKVKWNYNFSWSFSKSGSLSANIKTKMESYSILSEKELLEFGDFLQVEMINNFKRIHFEDKTEGFEYLKIEPPKWAVILNLILSFLICFGVTLFVTNNEFDNRHLV